MNTDARFSGLYESPTDHVSVDDREVYRSPDALFEPGTYVRVGTGDTADDAAFGWSQRLDGVESNEDGGDDEGGSAPFVGYAFPPQTLQGAAPDYWFCVGRALGPVIVAAWTVFVICAVFGLVVVADVAIRALFTL